MRRAKFFILIAIFLFPGAIPALSRNDGVMSNHPITVDGIKRTYLIFVPSRYRKGDKLPLVVVFHGGGGTAKGVVTETGLTQTAEKYGFIAAFPNAVPGDRTKPASFAKNPQEWNDGSGRFPGREGVDDVQFVRSMIEEIGSNYGTDRKHIYATGFSNGASMTFRVGAELSSLFAAIAPVAGALWINPAKLEQPVSLLYITGDSDTLNPINGGVPKLANGKAFGGKIGEMPKPPVVSHIEQWKKLLEMTEEARVLKNEGGIRILACENSRNKSEIVFYTLKGHGHTWPDGNNSLPEKMVGRDTKLIDTNEVIWKFFTRHGAL